MVQQDPVVMADTFLASRDAGARCLRGAGVAVRWKRYNWQIWRAAWS